MLRRRRRADRHRRGAPHRARRRRTAVSPTHRSISAGCGWSSPSAPARRSRCGSSAARASSTGSPPPRSRWPSGSSTPSPTTLVLARVAGRGHRAPGDAPAATGRGRLRARRPAGADRGGDRRVPGRAGQRRAGRAPGVACALALALLDVLRGGPGGPGGADRQRDARACPGWRAVLVLAKSDLVAGILNAAIGIGLALALWDHTSRRAAAHRHRAGVHHVQPGLFQASTSVDAGSRPSRVHQDGGALDRHVPDRRHRCWTRRPLACSTPTTPCC